MKEVDLLIIGSGPAGLSTALHLLQQDSSWAQRMVVIEKSAHPRPKLCAGGVTRIGLETLRNLGIQLPLPIPGVEVNEVRLLYQGRRISVHGKPEFVVYNRIEFDDYLAQHARQRGAVIRENEAVEHIDLNSTGVLVKTSRDAYLARAVVGADGSKGITRRLVERKRIGSRVARVLETTCPGDATEPQFTDGYATIDFTPARQHLQGYFWDFPSRVAGQARFNRGVYDSRMMPELDRANLPILLESGLSSLGEEVNKVGFQGHPIKWFNPRDRFALPRLLLVGDAAGADSLMGEGIGPALAYGKLAAEVINRAFQQLDFSFSDYKRRLLTSMLGRYLLYRWFLAWLSYHLSGSSLFVYTLWAVGKIVADLWPKSGPLYSTGSQKDNRASSDKIKDYAH